MKRGRGRPPISQRRRDRVLALLRAGWPADRIERETGLASFPMIKKIRIAAGIAAYPIGRPRRAFENIAETIAADVARLKEGL